MEQKISLALTVLTRYIESTVLCLAVRKTKTAILFITHRRYNPSFYRFENVDLILYNPEKSDGFDHVST